jgi:hypothetical protein
MKNNNKKEKHRRILGEEEIMNERQELHKVLVPLCNECEAVAPRGEGEREERTVAGKDGKARLRFRRAGGGSSEGGSCGGGPVEDDGGERAKDGEASRGRQDLRREEVGEKAVGAGLGVWEFDFGEARAGWELDQPGEDKR